MKMCLVVHAMTPAWRVAGLASRRSLSTLRLTTAGRRPLGSLLQWHPSQVRCSPVERPCMLNCPRGISGLAEGFSFVEGPTEVSYTVCLSKDG